jgi:hypothetical protein
MWRAQSRLRSIRLQNPDGLNTSAGTPFSSTLTFILGVQFLLKPYEQQQRQESHPIAAPSGH